MQYVRPAPERPGMPILGYFVVVGCTLLGLLFAADLYLPKKQQLSFASNLDGLPAAYKGDPKPLPAAAPHIAPLPAIAETTGSGSGVTLAGAGSKPVLAAAAVPVVQAAKPAKRKVVVARRPQRDYQEDNFGSFGRQDFARQDYGRQNYGSRESFGRESSREPSWRDSWAQSQYQQREPRSRSARSGNDFGNFGGNFGYFR
jgi:hypothetical protein